MIATMDPRVRERYEFIPQAILRRPPAFFAAQGISFRNDTDDLNDYQVAELALDGELPFALMRHEVRQRTRRKSISPTPYPWMTFP